MNDRTVSQAILIRDALCKEEVVKLLKIHRSGQTPCAMFEELHRQHEWVSNAMVRRVIRALVEAEQVESQQNPHQSKVYFMVGAGPRHGGIVVPAASAPRVARAPEHWASALGAPTLFAVHVASVPCQGHAELSGGRLVR